MNEASIKKAFLWNMLGSGMNAAMTMILTVITAQVVGAEASGILNLAFGLAFIFSCVATFETRTYQVTDRQGKFSFNEYLGMRWLTCIAGIACSLIYVAVLGYSGDKAVVVFSICLFKIGEAVSDVFQGLFQAQGRMDTAGKTLFWHTLIATGVYCLTLVLTNSPTVSAVTMPIVSASCLLLYDGRTAKQFVRRIRLQLRKISIKGITKECWTLAASSIMVIYVINAEKLVIDQYVPEMQAAWAALSMPSAFINLFAQFAFKPMLTGMADAWHNGAKQEFRRLCLKIYMGIGGLSIVVVIGGVYMGLPVLEFLYKTPLCAYGWEMAVILLGGGFNALGAFLWHVLIVIRSHKWVVVGDVAAFAFTLLGVPFLVRMYSVTGAAAGYTISMLIRTLVFGFVVARNMNRS